MYLFLLPIPFVLTASIPESKIDSIVQDGSPVLTRVGGRFLDVCFGPN